MTRYEQVCAERCPSGCEEGLPLMSDGTHHVWTCPDRKVACTAPTIDKWAEELAATLANRDSAYDLLHARVAELEAENARLRNAIEDVRSAARNPWKWERCYSHPADVVGIPVGLVIYQNLDLICEKAIADPAVTIVGDSALSPATAAEPQADPLRNALEDLVSAVQSLMPDYVSDERSVFGEWDGVKRSLAAAREALKGGRVDGR